MTNVHQSIADPLLDMKKSATIIVPSLMLAEMNNEDRWASWLGGSGSRRRTAAFWLTCFFSLALIQVVLPIFIHNRVNSHRIKTPIVESADEHTALWSYPRLIADADVQGLVDRVRIKIVIPSTSRYSYNTLEKTLSSILKATEKQNCYKGSPFSTMVFDMDPYNNPAFAPLKKQFRLMECFEFYRNNSNLHSKLFKPSTERLEENRSIEYANLLFMINKFHPDSHILMMNDDMVICPEDNLLLLRKTAALADAAGDFGIIFPTNEKRDGIPAAILIGKSAGTALAEFIAKTEIL